MAHIVIMGAGIGGLPAAYEMRDHLPREHKVTVVNAVDYFQFVPSNPWIAVGWRKRDDIVLPLAPMLQKKGIEFVGKPVTKIDPGANRLELGGGGALDYDYLVIVTGPKLAFDEVPGAGPASSGGGGHTHSVCTVDHAEAFFKDYEGFLQNPGPVVIGAMPGA
ncbi:MAG: FAD-dependent oxidoreductase, partial [Rubrivivax sp.]|nr:FAD-dependent oxidoreductase [Rubrivivax sp.]